MYKELKKLEVLGISDNNITDISPLSELTDLRVLYINSNKISDINILKGLTGLEALAVRHGNADLMLYQQMVPEQLCKLYLLRE